MKLVVILFYRVGFTTHSEGTTPRKPLDHLVTYHHHQNSSCLKTDCVIEKEAGMQGEWVDHFAQWYCHYQGHVEQVGVGVGSEIMQYSFTKIQNSSYKCKRSL